MSGSAGGSVPIEIGIGEAAGATVEERRDAHEVYEEPLLPLGEGGAKRRMRVPAVDQRQSSARLTSRARGVKAT